MAAVSKISVKYMKFQESFSYHSTHFYYGLITLLYLGYIVSFLGVYYVAPDYTETLSIIIRLFVALVLLIRFNPMVKVKINNNDRLLISAVAFFLILNTTITEYIFHYVNKMKNGLFF